MLEIGERIKKLRKEYLNNLSQSEFGEKLGVSRSVIKNIELGVVQPKDLFLSHICEIFNVNKDWLDGIDVDDNNIFRPLFSINEYDLAVSKIGNGEHEFIKKALIKYSKLTPENQAIIDQFLDSLLEGHE